MKHFIYAFLLAVLVYATFYAYIEHRRVRKGPWEVTFESEGGRPSLRIAQGSLSISNVTIVFDGARTTGGTSGLPSTVRFDESKPVPFELPLGRCIFMDLTFLPGSITFDILGHQVELLPRALIMDGRDYTWRSSEVHILSENTAERAKTSKQ